MAFGNALQHIFWQIAWGGCTSGVITATFLIMPITLWTSFIAVTQELVSLKFLGVLYVLPILMLYPVVTTGRLVTPLMQKLHEFGAIIVILLGY